MKAGVQGSTQWEGEENTRVQVLQMLAGPAGQLHVGHSTVRHLTVVVLWTRSRSSGGWEGRSSAHMGDQGEGRPRGGHG